MVRGTKRSRSQSSSLSPVPDTPPPVSSPKLTPSSQRTKKLALLEQYTSSSPFPNFPHPTPDEARAVHALIAPKHPRRSPDPSETGNSAATCGNTQDVLDALIGTILSQNTSSANSTRAKRHLDDTFGRHNFAAIASAPHADVEEALRSGGLANKKATVIQSLLASVHAAHGTYSLQHLAHPSVTRDMAMAELVSYAGVGPKTAACVLMFCLGRADAFAVDTHVFRLARVLGWVPREADRVTAQVHLERVLPDEVKYGLHVGMVRHGRACKGCRGSGKAKGAQKEVEGCVLRKWVRDSQGGGGEDEVSEDTKVELKVEEDVKEAPSPKKRRTTSPRKTKMKAEVEE